MEENMKKVTFDEKNLDKLYGGVRNKVSDGGDSLGREWYYRNRNTIKDEFVKKYGLKGWPEPYYNFFTEVMTGCFGEKSLKKKLKDEYGIDCDNLM